jgi:plasmid stabilization system protein ParE
LTLYQLTDQAKADLIEAIDYIAEDNESASVRWEQRMLDTFEHLAQWPGSGRIRSEFTPHPLHFWVEGNYLILYDASSQPLVILAIFHGAQDIARILAERLETGE